MGNLKGIGLFVLEIIGLISSGEKEKVSDIEKHIDNNDVVEYIYNKYKNKFSIHFDGSTYSNSAINKYFNNYSGYIEGNESRKYGIFNEEDGLLLIIALITDKIEEESISWTI